MTDEQLASAYDITTRTARNVRKRCIEQGIEFAVNGKPRERRCPIFLPYGKDSGSLWTFV